MSEPECFLEIEPFRQCCCQCKWHYEDHRHCNVDKTEDDEGCICGQVTGYVCGAPEFYNEETGKQQVYSGWREHSLGCEMYQQREKVK